MNHSVLVETSRRFVEAFLPAGKGQAGGRRDARRTARSARPLNAAIFGAGLTAGSKTGSCRCCSGREGRPAALSGDPGAQTRADFRSASNAASARCRARWPPGCWPQPRNCWRWNAYCEPMPITPRATRCCAARRRGQDRTGRRVRALDGALATVPPRRLCLGWKPTTMYLPVSDALGRQLVGDKYSVAAFDDRASHPPGRACARSSSPLLVVDNLERIPLPPFLAGPRPRHWPRTPRDALAGHPRCAHGCAQGQTRLLFTSRSPARALRRPPAQRTAPLPRPRGRSEAIEQVLDAEAGLAASPTWMLRAGRSSNWWTRCWPCPHAGAARARDPAPGHWRRRATRSSRLMAAMEVKQFPGSREQSVFASVELSLRRLSPDNWERARALGVFHAVSNSASCAMMGWGRRRRRRPRAQAGRTGLAWPMRHHHLSLNPRSVPICASGWKRRKPRRSPRLEVATMRGVGLNR